MNFTSPLICIQGLLMKHDRIGSVAIWVLLRRRTHIADGGRGRSRMIGWGDKVDKKWTNRTIKMFRIYTITINPWNPISNSQLKTDSAVLGNKGRRKKWVSEVQQIPWFLGAAIAATFITLFSSNQSPFLLSLYLDHSRTPLSIFLWWLLSLN